MTRLEGSWRLMLVGEQRCSFSSDFPIMTTVLILAWKLFIPLLFVFALIDVLTQSQEQRIRRMKRSGKSQAAIAEKLNITRYRVRMALA